MSICRLLLMTMLLVQAGCQTLGSLSASKWLASEQPRQANEVVEILTLWQPGEGRDVSGLPTRGFAGQVFFFASGSRTPVEVDDDVKVYVFDDYADAADQAKPLHVFKFEAGAWKKYLRPSKVGPSYHVFIPYTRPGTHRAKCQLRVRVGGGPGSVLSDAADLVLTGAEQPTQTAKNGAKSNVKTRSRADEIAALKQRLRELEQEHAPVQTVAHEMPAATDKTYSRNPSGTLKTYTIPLK